MFPLGSEGGFHFRMIWDEELETDIGSNGTDGTAWVGKETEVTSTALQELDRTKDKHKRVSISMGIKSALHSKSTDTQQSCSRIHQCARKLVHVATWAWRKKSTLAPSPHAGKHTPSHLFRNTFLPKKSSNGSGKFHRYGTIMTTRQKTIQLSFLFTCKATLI